MPIRKTALKVGFGSKSAANKDRPSKEALPMNFSVKRIEYSSPAAAPDINGLLPLSLRDSP